MKLRQALWLGLACSCLQVVLTSFAVALAHERLDCCSEGQLAHLTLFSSSQRVGVISCRWSNAAYATFMEGRVTERSEEEKKVMRVCADCLFFSMALFHPVRRALSASSCAKVFNAFSCKNAQYYQETGLCPLRSGTLRSDNLSALNGHTSACEKSCAFLQCAPYSQL